MLINITKINLNPNVGGGKPIELENKEITITENGAYTVEPSEGFGGMSSVDIDVYIANPAEEIDFSEIGYDATDNQNANMAIQDGIEYAKKIQAEYTDTKTYMADYQLVYFPMVDTSNAANFNNRFKTCYSLQYIPPLTISNKCTKMNSTFYNCFNLKKIDTTNWDVSNVTDMGYLFYGTNALEELKGIENWNTSNVTSMGTMFQNCNSLSSLDLSNWNTSNVTSMGTMFSGCSSLTSLDLSNWNTSNVTIMSYMFNGCSSLTSLELSNWDTSNVTIMSYMFQNCNSLSSLDLSNWDTSNVINMNSMFIGCSSLTSLDLSNWNTSNVTSMNSMFSGCSLLTNFQAPQNINASINFRECNLLTVDSLLSILSNLADRTNTTSLTCTLGTTNLNKLTDEQKAIATNKNWVLA